MITKLVSGAGWSARLYKYNHKRPHRSVDMMFPTDAHKQSGTLKKHWKKRPYPLKHESGDT